jgi:hypothetical protein
MSTWKMTNGQIMIYKDYGKFKRSTIKTGVNSGGRASSGTRHVALVSSRMLRNDEERNGLWLWQSEHIHGHLWHSYTVTINQDTEATVQLSKW